MTHKTIEKHFDSIWDFCRYVCKRTNDQHFSRTFPRRPGFCELTFDEWVATIEQGIVPGYEDFDWQLQQATQALRRNYDRNIVGQFYDIGGLLCGDPESGYVSRTVRHSLHVTMFIMVGFCSRVHSEDLTNRAIAALALADKIRGNGGTVTTYAVRKNTSRFSRGICKTCYQITCETPMELYLTLQPATLRRGGFAFLEIATNQKSCENDAYGTSDESFRPMIDSDIQQCLHNGDMVITMDSDIQTVSGFTGNIQHDIDWILSQNMAQHFSTVSWSQ